MENVNVHLLIIATETKIIKLIAGTKRAQVRKYKYPGCSVNIYPGYPIHPVNIFNNAIIRLDSSR
jgi:hypothetical protein